MFSARPAAEHSARKRLISHVYSKSYIQSSAAAAAQSQAILYDRFLPILKDSGAEGHAAHGIDIYSVFMAATMDFIASYIFGLDNGSDFLGDKAYREHFLELYKARNDYGYYDQELSQLTKLCRSLGIPLCPKWADSANKELASGACSSVPKWGSFLTPNASLTPAPSTSLLSGTPWWAGYRKRKRKMAVPRCCTRQRSPTSSFPLPRSCLTTS
jgi:hypothetical protein